MKLGHHVTSEDMGCLVSFVEEGGGIGCWFFLTLRTGYTLVDEDKCQVLHYVIILGRVMASSHRPETGTDQAAQSTFPAVRVRGSALRPFQVTAGRRGMLQVCKRTAKEGPADIPAHGRGAGLDGL